MRGLFCVLIGQLVFFFYIKLTISLLFTLLSFVLHLCCSCDDAKMFPIMMDVLLCIIILFFQIEKQEFGLKPMNCPGHCLMFEHRVRSYRGEIIESLNLILEAVKRMCCILFIIISTLFQPCLIGMGMLLLNTTGLVLSLD